VLHLLRSSSLVPSPSFVSSSSIEVSGWPLASSRPRYSAPVSSSCHTTTITLPWASSSWRSASTRAEIASNVWSVEEPVPSAAIRLISTP
jgi:hypothetical protein